MISIYLWLKAVHLIAVISWMAGLFYLPRLYVYHAERGVSCNEPTISFIIMEEKLLKLIMTPAMIVSWFCGSLLAFTPGVVDWSAIWPWTKIAAVITMTFLHFWLARQRNELANGHGLSGKTYRLVNELPTFLLIVVILSVILKF